MNIHAITKPLLARLLVTYDDLTPAEKRKVLAALGANVSDLVEKVTLDDFLEVSQLIPDKQ